MTGYKDYNRAAFDEAKGFCKQLGWKVVNPFDNGVEPSAPFWKHLRKDFKMLLKCNAIYQLEDWQKSQGASMEYLVGRNSGIPTYKFLNLCYASYFQDQVAVHNHQKCPRPLITNKMLRKALKP